MLRAFEMGNKNTSLVNQEFLNLYIWMSFLSDTSNDLKVDYVILNTKQTRASDNYNIVHLALNLFTNYNNSFIEHILYVAIAKSIPLLASGRRPSGGDAIESWI